MEGSGADERWRVPLPDAAHPPLEVFVNGVPQDEGRDYSIEPHGDGRALAFSRPLQKEGRLGFWRWALMFFAIVGTYRKHDSVDVRYRAGDETRLATGLEIVAPKSVSP
ncbi:hypothetical protein BH20ACT15_BH20ACT15_16290 [soil metagenome]|jgi:hypothetical protein